MPVPTERLKEDATDAMARLDIVCATSPRSFSAALHFAAISDLASAGPKGTRSLAVAFAGSPGDLPPDLLRWKGFLEEEERRARGGAPLTLARLVRSGFALPTAERGTEERAAAIDGALRAHAAGARPSALHRALDVAATIDDRAFGEAAAALVLCAEGRTDRVRLLPFDAVPVGERDAAVARWCLGDEEPWRTLALGALITRARACRAALERALLAMPAEDRSLARFGRAAITARRALALLREELASTVPLLAEALGLSRPAADDAIARLHEAGLVRELTGRKRDRVFAYATAIAVTE